MKKRDKNVLIGFLVVLGIVLVISLGGFKSFATVPLSSDLGECLNSQSNFFSIDRVDIVGTGERWRIYGKAGGGSECLQIAMTPEQLNQYLNSKSAKATKPIYGNIKLIKYIRTFPINPSTQQPYYFKIISNNLVTRGWNGNYDNLYNFCKSKYPDTVYAYAQTSLNSARCVIASSNGQIGEFTGVSYDDLDLQVTINGNTEHFTRSRTSGQIGSNFLNLAGGNAKFEWQGNLNNLNNVGTPYQYMGRLVSSKWTLLNRNTLTQSDSASTKFRQCMESKQLFSLGDTTHGQNTDGDFDICIDDYLYVNYPELDDQTSVYEDNIRDVAYDVNTDNGALYASLKAPPLPTFTLDLDAEWVGIVLLAGKPDITSCIQSPTVLDSGTPKTVDFRIKNIGEASGKFFGGVQCGQGITGTVNEFNIEKNQEMSMTAYLIGSNTNQNDLNTQCTLTIEDSKSNVKDTCVFSGTVKYVSGITCQPNSLVCDDQNKNILKCSVDGKTREPYKTCELGCKIDVKEGAVCKSTEICNDGIDNDKDGKIDKEDSDCQNGKNWWDKIKDFFSNLFGGAFSFLLIIKYVIVIGVGFISIFITQDVLQGVRGLKGSNRDLVRWIISIFVGIGLGFALYKFIGGIVFWILSIVALIYFIFSAKIKSLLRLR